MPKTGVCPYARRGALTLASDPDLLTKATATLESLGPLPASHTPEANALSENLKPLQYALLAHLVRSVVETTLDQPPAHPGKWAKSSARKLESVIERSLDKGAASSLQDPRNHALFQSLQRLQGTLWPLNPNRHQGVTEMLQGGNGTAAYHLSTLVLRGSAELQNIPGYTTSEEKLAILRKSHGLIRDPASLNTDQIYALQRDYEEGGHPAISINTHPAIPVLQYEPSLSDHQVGATMQTWAANFHLSNRADNITLADISSDRLVIGCPVLLTPQLTERLWNWSIDRALELGVLPHTLGAAAMRSEIQA